MHERTTPRKIPDSGNVFRITLDGQPERVFRVPAPTKLEPILSAMTSPEMRDLAATARENVANAAGKLQGSMSAMCGLIGAVVGVSWFDEHHDLDTPAWDGQADSLKSYGEAVFEELWDEGLTFVEIFLYWVDCYAKIGGTFRTQKILMERAGFFGKVEEPPTTSSSTSASDTTATPSPGGA